MEKTRLHLSEKMCRNIYYMLCNAPEELQYMEVGKIHFENVQGVDNLLAALICNSLDIWDRNKMLREYKMTTIKTDKPKGRIDFVKSYSSGALAKGMLVCNYHKLNNDTVPNRIIKFALASMLRYGDNIDEKYMTKISKKYNELTGIKSITIDEYITMPKSFRELPIYYKPILSASRIAIENILANTYNREDEQLTELFKLEDDRRYQYIFEQFTRKFYADLLEPLGMTVSKPVYHQYNTHGDIDADTELSGWDNPDIVIKYGNTAAVIDTKWYTAKHNISANKNEVSNYVSECADYNEELTNIHGIVLYAKDPNGKIQNRAFNTPFSHRRSYRRDIYQRVINMDDDFDSIKQHLVDIVTEVFGDVVQI